MEHLADIHSYYFLDPDNEKDIKPISRIDCEIIEVLISILERQGNKVLHDIICRWKLIPDTDLVEQLEEYLDSESLEEDMKERGGDMFAKLLEKLKKAYITIGDHQLHASKIFIISKSDSHNGNRPIYSIIINKEEFLPDGTSSWYSNLSEDFINKEDRDKKLDELKRLLSKNTMCRFLN